LPLFARRPAPVQASWLGYAATTGLTAMDYLIPDRWTAPAGADAGFREALVRLPHARFTYGPPPDAPACAPPPSLAGGLVTFGSFNNLAKLGDAVVALWAAVLRAVPGSRLVLKWAALGDEAVARRLAGRFEAAGAPEGALMLRGFSPHQAMLAEYADIDIALDPFPFGGGLTSCEALWMGVPVVTLPGETMASRQSLGFLQAVGLADLAACDAEDYVRIAAALAKDVSARATLRESLRARMARAPLGDPRAFTASLETAYRALWRRWCAGERPAALDIR
jgi:predicted O-linked N-acetylglucosamine transferase (SPINDLY family)